MTTMQALSGVGIGSDGVLKYIVATLVLVFIIVDDTVKGRSSPRIALYVAAPALVS